MTTPLIVRNGDSYHLKRLTLAPKQDERASSWREADLQDLVQKHPDLLPIREIEPGFGTLIPVAREVPCAHGFIDNLFVTAEGDIAVVEMKLWRNQQARREVVVQLLDYAAALRSMDYEAFQSAVLQGQFFSPAPRSLYEVVSRGPDRDGEIDFIDAVARNLRQGRILLIAVGDGIRSEAETLAGLLQAHAGARFTFALVAIELFETGRAGEILAVPKTIAKTVLIERGVVNVADTRITIGESQPTPPLTPVGARTTLTEGAFMEAMARRSPSLPDALRAFIGKLARRGIEADWRQSLNLRWRAGPNGPVNLGYITKDGAYWTDVVRNRVPEAVARAFLERLAALVGGRIKDPSSSMGPYLVSSQGAAVTVEDMLQHEEGWLDAMDHLLNSVRNSGADDEEGA